VNPLNKRSGERDVMTRGYRTDTTGHVTPRRSHVLNAWSVIRGFGETDATRHRRRRLPLQAWPMSSLNYHQAGADIDAGDQLVCWIEPQA
jgi:hypothetical protein